MLRESHRSADVCRVSSGSDQLEARVGETRYAILVTYAGSRFEKRNRFLNIESWNIEPTFLGV